MAGTSSNLVYCEIGVTEQNNKKPSGIHYSYRRVSKTENIFIIQKKKEKHILHASTQTHINTQLACHYLNSLYTENKMEMSKILSYLLSSPSEKQVGRC